MMVGGGIPYQVAGSFHRVFIFHPHNEVLPEFDGEPI